VRHGAFCMTFGEPAGLWELPQGRRLVNLPLIFFKSTVSLTVAVRVTSLYITDAARNGKSCTASDPSRCS
jgi:hypothetical protein